MLKAVLQIFTSEQKAEAILSNPMIELIFMILFLAFFVTFLVHICLYHKLKNIRNYLKETNRMDIDPLRDFKEQFDRKQQEEPVKVETFVQEKFSGWRLFNVPVVSLIKMVQMTVSVFILIGVLGTFIGLTMSLGSIDAGGDQLVEDVASVLAGIDVAFYTSIAGMGFSLMMTVINKVFNTEYLLTDIMLKVESNLEENEQNGFRKLIDVSETINKSILKLQETNQKSLQGIENSFNGFKDYTEGLQQSAEDLAKFNDGLSNNLQEFHVLFSSMKEITDGFDQATTKLNKNFDQLFDYFKKMDGRNERLTKTFEDTYEKIKEVSTTQIDTLRQFEDSVEDLKTFTSSTVEGQEAAKDAFEKMNRKSNDLVKRMEEHNKEFKRIFGDSLSSKLSSISSHLSELTNGFDQLGDSIVQLPHALETINETQVEYKHLLSDRFEELKQFNKDFNNHLKAHSADSVAFEKHLLDATNTYEQVGIKNNQLIHEINTTISQMNNVFNQRENQLEANVGMLKDTLSKYVNSLEGTLGDKLDKVVRNIGDYVEITNDGIKKEFKELRLITEEIQQSSSRYTQQTFNELSQEIQKLNRQLHSFSGETAKRNNRVGMTQNDQ
ncbi:MotA/TolQ/ExbB proton channel family protein [Aquibacillus albus]|uniref:ABC-type transporter Mla subunit MlaD n=1 Tax=Aquibacillus albus TaxID=1168171 RepID=A0ABS2MXV5_9BACI|nr:MotA/TolQ/ExbB proton channel family protein [Aquibacillus albus]MBM7570717.1 ABC-type transporter Mla subunit MlaD [Aquibacillus albus]